MEKGQKKFKALITSCWVMLFACWLFTIITSKYIPIWCENEKFIELCNLIDNNIFIQLPLKLVMYYFNWIFIIYAILRKKLLTYKPILISSIIIVFWIIKQTLYQYQFINYIDFLMIIPLAIMLKKQWYKSFLGMALTFVFSLISSLVKGLCIINTNANDLPSIVIIIYSIDVYIMCIIYYLYYRKGEQNNGCVVSILQIKQKMESIKCSFRNCFSSSNRIYRAIRNWNNLSLKDVYFFYCSVIFFIITYGTILLVGILFDRIIEVSVCVLFFHIFRIFDNKTYHASNDFMCWLISTISFSVITLLSLTLTQSIFACICMSYILTKVMFFIKDYIDLKIEINNMVKSTLEEVSEEDLIHICNQMKVEDVKLVYKYLHQNKIADIFCMKNGISRRTLFRYLKQVREIYKEFKARE
jgi:hypothetical protein